MKSEIESIEQNIQNLPATPVSIEDNFDRIGETLSEPAACLSMREFTLFVDEMLVKRDPDAGGRVEQLELLEMVSSNGERRVVLFGWIPVSELPEKQDFLKEASRYLV